MPFVTSYEIFSREEGFQQGFLEGVRAGQLALMLRQLRKLLGGLDEVTVRLVNGLPTERLEDLAEALLDFSCGSDLQEWLRTAQ